jgi:hypothetical protein
MPRGVALTCPRTYNNNSHHIPLWLLNGHANALHLITNNLPQDLGTTPSPSLCCFILTSSFSDAITSSVSSLSDKARGNGHFDDGMPTRHQPSSPTSRQSPYYEGTSSLKSRHHHSSIMTTGATLCLRASTSVGCTFIIPQPAFRCSMGHKWTCYQGAF